MQRFQSLLMLAVFYVFLPSVIFAQEGSGNAPGKDADAETEHLRETGRGMGRGMGRGPRNGGHGQGGGPAHGKRAGDDRHDEDHEVFQYLLRHHDKITRHVKELPNGVETLTESDVEAIAGKIKEHVEWMQYRVENTHPIRMRDPLFAELFRHTEKIKMVHEDTTNGVRVTETSDDPYVAQLIQEHAKAVTGFVQSGFAEAMKNHALPQDEPPQKPKTLHPVIASYGGVVRLPDAAMQPQRATKLLVDFTRNRDAMKRNGALEKVAKYLNIFGGAGRVPADVEIAVVFHGDATLDVLNAESYAKRFGTKGNPNIELLQQLHEAGVEMYVCGQSLIAKGSTPNDVVVFVETAVSALTSVVNLQVEGFAYLPLRDL